MCVCIYSRAPAWLRAGERVREPHAVHARGGIRAHHVVGGGEVAGTECVPKFGNGGGHTHSRAANVTRPRHGDDDAVRGANR